MARKSRIKPGQKYVRWTVLSPSSEKSKSGRTCWVCVCDCGRRKSILGARLLSGGSGSCGCLQVEVARSLVKERNTSHGLSHSAEYRIWKEMKRRCSNETRPEWHNYGGRGIRVCRWWRKSFTNFIADMGSRPTPKHSLDRIDNDGPYAPWNCRWATRKEQMRNFRRNHVVTVDGCSKSIVEWSETTGIPARQIESRLRHGWDSKDAVMTPTDSASNGWSNRR